MFNTSYSSNFSNETNAVSGTLRKSHPKSKFCIRVIKDNLFVFSDGTPRLEAYSEEIVILQVMLVGGNRVLIEYVPKSKFEETEED